MRYKYLLAFAALCFAAPVSAATYTVSPTGSDSNNGVSAPFQTLQKVAAVLQPGDTAVFQPGTYRSGAYIETSNITLRANGDVTIDGTNGARNEGISLSGVSNVTIDGFKIKNCVRFGIFCVLSDHVTIQNCDVSYNGVTGILTGNTSDLLIQNNTTNYNKKEHGIYASQSGDRIRILNNRIIGNVGSGLQVNAVEDSPNASAGASSDSRSMNCVIAGNVMSGNCQVGGASMNFMGLQNSLVVNNLAYNDGNAGAMALWDDGAGAAFACKNNQVFHNTIVFGAGKGHYGIQCASGSTGNVIKDNIVVVNAGPALDLEESVQANCNLYGNDNVANGSSLAAWRNQTGNDQNSRVGDPMLDADYRPRAGSPCIDGAEQTYGTDKDGALRPQGAGPDIGCYEVGGSAGGGGSTPTAPGAPSGLTAQGGNAQVSLSWSSVSGAATYNVYRAASQSGSFAKVSGVSGTSFTDAAVSNGSTYWYKVCGVNTAGEGAASTVANATPQAPAAQTFSISGSVTVNGVGLSGVTVSTGGAWVVTNGSGVYSLASLPAGSYNVACTLSGYSFSAPQSVTVGPNRSGLNFTATQNAQPAPSSSLIYDDVVANGWKGSNYRASYSIANSSPVKQGAKSMSFAVTGVDGWAGFSGAAINTTGKSTLKFWVNGGKKGRQYLRVRLLVNGVVKNSVNLWNYGGAPQAGGWVEYSVPLADLQAGGASVTGIRFTAGKPTTQSFIDYIRVE